MTSMTDRQIICLDCKQQHEVGKCTYEICLHCGEYVYDGIQCDKCNRWYHYICANVKTGTYEGAWNCPLCDLPNLPNVFQDYELDKFGDLKGVDTLLGLEGLEELEGVEGFSKFEVLDRLPKGRGTDSDSGPKHSGYKKKKSRRKIKSRKRSRRKIKSRKRSKTKSRKRT